jgi:hypothetical protein
LLGELDLLVRELALAQQPFEQGQRRGRHEGGRQLRAGELGKEVVAARDASRGIARQARRRATHDRGRERHERRDRDVRDAARQVTLGHGRFEPGLARRMDQVRAPGRAARCEGGFDLSDAGFHLRERQPSRTEEGEHAGPRHRDHQAGRRNAIGHLAGDVREAHAVRLGEGTATEPLRVHRPEDTGQSKGVSVRRGALRFVCLTATFKTNTDTAVSIAHQIDGLSQASDTRAERARIEGGRGGSGYPPHEGSARVRERSAASMIAFSPAADDKRATDSSVR